MNDHNARITPEGEAFRELYRRLVAVHYSLAAAGPDDREREARTLDGLMDALRFIDEQPAYRAAREAHGEVAPTTRQERAKAI